MVEVQISRLNILFTAEITTTLLLHRENEFAVRSTIIILSLVFLFSTHDWSPLLYLVSNQFRRYASVVAEIVSLLFE